MQHLEFWPAAIMADEPVTIENVPNVRDARCIASMPLQGIGAKVERMCMLTQFRINGRLYM